MENSEHFGPLIKPQSVDPLQEAGHSHPVVLWYIHLVFGSLAHLVTQHGFKVVGVFNQARLVAIEDFPILRNQSKV